MTDPKDQQQTGPGDLSRGTLLIDQAQLADVPPRSVVRAADGTIAARFNDELGVVFGDDRPFPWSVLRVPALVLWVDGDSLALPGEASVEAQPSCTCGSPDAYSLNPAEVLVHRVDEPCYIAEAKR